MGRFHKVDVGGATLIAVQDSWAAMPPTAFFNQDHRTPTGTTTAICWTRTVNLTLNLGSWLVICGRHDDPGRLGHRRSADAMMPLKEPPALPTVMQEAGVARPTRSTSSRSRTCTSTTPVGTPGTTTVRAGPAIPQRAACHPAGPSGITGPAATSFKQGAPVTTTCSSPILDAGLGRFRRGRARADFDEVVTVPTPGHTPGHVSHSPCQQRRREGVRDRRRRPSPGPADGDRLVPRARMSIPTDSTASRTPAVRSDRGRERADRVGPLQLPRAGASRAARDGVRYFAAE